MQGLNHKEFVDSNRRRTLNGGVLQEPSVVPPPPYTPSKNQKLHLGAAATSYYFSGTKSKSQKKHSEATEEMSIEFGNTSMMSLGGHSSSSSEESDLLNQSVLSDTTELTASNFILAAASRQMLLESKPFILKNQFHLQDQENSAGNNNIYNDNNKQHNEGTPSTTTITREPLKPFNTTPMHMSQATQNALLRDLSDSLRKHREQESSFRRSPGSTTSSYYRRDTLESSKTHGMLTKILPPITPASGPITAASAKSVASSVSTATENSSRTSDVSATSLDDLFAGLLDASSKGPDTSMDSPLLTPNSIAQSASLPSVQSPQTEFENGSTTPGVASPDKITHKSPSRLTPGRLFISPARSQHSNEGPSVIINEDCPSPPSTKADAGAPFRLTPHLHQSRLTPTKIAPSPRRITNPGSATSPARNTRSKSPQKLAIAEIIATTHHAVRSRLSDISMMSAIDPKKRRNSDITSETALTQDLNAIFSNESPAPNANFQKTIPKSILNSSKKHKINRDSLVSRKSVAFGSPEAAEYRIGSPSVSLTPMPHKQAKALYAIPSDSSSESPGSFSDEASLPSSVLSGGDDPTVQMDNNLNSILTQEVVDQDMDFTEASIESKITDPDVKAKNDTPSYETTIVLTSDLTNTSMNSISETVDEDKTVELEDNIQNLLTNTLANEGSPDTKSHSYHSSSPDDSVDMTDAESIVSANMQLPNRDSTSSNSSQKLIFSPKPNQNVSAMSLMSETTSIAMDEGENTVELEGDIAALLAVATQGSSDADTSDELRSIKLTEMFPKMQSSIAPRSNRMSFGDSQIISIDDDVSDELESTMDSVLIASDNPKPNQSIISTSLMNDTTSIAMDEGENTVDLEDNLAALLAVATHSHNDADTSDELWSIKLTDKFLKMPSNIAPRSNCMLLGDSQVISKNDHVTDELESTMDSVLIATNTFTMDEDVTETVELETTMDSVLEAAESSDTNTEEGATETIALEANMSSLLHIAGRDVDERETILTASVLDKDEVFHFDLSDTPKTSGDPRRRSSSASSRRFSIAPRGRVSLSKDGNIFVNEQDETFLLDMSPKLAQEIDLTTEDDEPYDEMLELTSKQIDDMVGLRAIAMYHEIDSVVEAKAVSTIAKNQFITEAMEEFVEAVCIEVEGKAESSSDSESRFQSLVEEIPEELLLLQKRLREDGGKKELISLTSAVQKFVENEWNSWETMVAEAMVGQVNLIPEEIEEDKGRIKKCVTLVDDTQEALSFMAGRAAQKARRRSMDRRVTAASKVEEEIRELEGNLVEARRELKNTTLQLEATQDAITREREADLIQQELALCRQSAELSQGKFVSLKGLSSSVPLEVGDSTLSIAFFGSSPKSCFTVSFNLHQQGPVSCTAIVDPAHFHSRRGRKMKYTPGITSFLKARISSMVGSASKSTLSSMTEVGLLLQRLEWTKGRIELTANEVTTLQRRYKVDITTDPESLSKSNFLVHVTFAGSSDKLFATFEVTATYPFGSQHVSLDTEAGQLNIDDLRKQLIKSAKPGFGYMSRACDVMCAFAR